jgi:hypothetical protein
MIVIDRERNIAIEADANQYKVGRVHRSLVNGKIVQKFVTEKYFNDFDSMLRHLTERSIRDSIKLGDINKMYDMVESRIKQIEEAFLL